MFWTWFSKSQARKPHGFVTREGSVARFAFSKRDFFSDGTPKAKVFTPEMNPELRRLETSVCGMSGVEESRLWFLGNTIRSPLRAVAAVELSVASVVEAGLLCEAAPEQGYPEHGVIIGWDEGSDAKDKRLSAMQDLVATASGIHRPPEQKACQ
jgi:hypothetical protein